MSIGPAVATRMACADEGVMDQETAYLTALESVASYEIRGDGLRLLDSEGNLLLEFRTQSQTADQA
jgi:heat shock protein HslJ